MKTIVTLAIGLSLILGSIGTGFAKSRSGHSKSGSHRSGTSSKRSKK
jgi:hypothetical protein